MRAPCLKTVVCLVIGYVLCAVVPVRGSFRQYQNSDPLKDYQLVLLQAIWRHGNRTQGLLPYPLTVEQSNELTAPYGMGSLTPRGRRQAFQMGRFLRERYGNFLPPYFTYSSTNLTCTEPSRTQESCLTGMAGLFPTAGPQVWQDQGLGAVWTPIPCQYRPAKEDEVYTQYINCPRMFELLLEFFDTPIFRAEVARLTNFGLVNEYITLNAGEESVNDLELTFFYDLFSSLEGDGQPLPDWARRVYPEPLRSVYGLYMSAFSGTPELAKLMTGEFWKKTMHLADSLQKGTTTPSDTVFYGYSLHDVNVAAIMSSLKPKNIARPVPPFSAVLMIEWYQYNGNPSRIALKFLYRNDTVLNTVTTLDIPGCGEVCPLKDIREAVKDLIPDQPRSEYCTGHLLTAPAELEFYRRLLSLWSP